MSRCFPYPPPGYTLSSARNEALTESIKLQKEKQRAKEKRREKKDKRKERKEKRKERKERKKEKKDRTNPDSDKYDIVEDHIGRTTHSDLKDESFLQKKREAGNEQFEQSNLTEEHGHPNGLPVPSSSYESTENSNKRKMHSSSIDGSQGNGKAILIRLPSRTKSDFHALAEGQQHCSISRPTDILAPHKGNRGLRDGTEMRNIEQGFTLRNNREEICSTSGQNFDAFALGKPGPRSMRNAVVSPMQEMEVDLLENWFPPRLQDASLYEDDFDWLFRDQRRNRDERAEKRQRSGTDSMSCSRSSALWPRAEYLQEIDAYALPFVVPY